MPQDVLRYARLELPRRHAYPALTPTRAPVLLRIFLRRPRLRFPTLRAGSPCKHDGSLDPHFLAQGKGRGAEQKLFNIECDRSKRYLYADVLPRAKLNPAPKDVFVFLSMQ
jgi:hypothetical protein